MIVLDQYYPGWRDLAIHESSPTNRGVSLKLKNECSRYLASQYFPDQPAGEILSGFRNENLENQTFPDQTFDIVVTQDVMEHVFRPDRAFSEIARTLKPGGVHIFSVPLVNKHDPTEIWSIQGEDDNPIFLKTPEWHGNPIGTHRSPVTMHWGFDIVDFRLFRI